MSTNENNYEQHSRELGRIGMWLDDFAKDDNDGAYLCFLRVLAELRNCQAQILETVIEREEAK